MNVWATKTVVGVIAGAVIVYVLLFALAREGYGYAGYGGWHRGPSFWYWGGATTYHEPSVRLGSVGGPAHLGGGLHGGK